MFFRAIDHECIQWFGYDCAGDLNTPPERRQPSDIGAEVAFQIDRVVLAWAHLEALAGAFASVGLATDYGGIHTNRVTHMATLGFVDGSYLELISVRQPGQQAPVWQHHIATNGGICAWSVSVGDVHRISDRLRRRSGCPWTAPGHRAAAVPTASTIESELAFVGAEGMGSLHPFMITDRTPREESGAGRGLRSTAADLRVSELGRARSSRRRDPGDRVPARLRRRRAGGHRRRCVPRPHGAASRRAGGDHVSGHRRRLGRPKRLGTYGPTPCACLVRSTNMATSRGSASTERADPIRGSGRGVDRLRSRCARYASVSCRE